MKKIIVLLIVVMGFQLCSAEKATIDSVDSKILYYTRANHTSSITMSVGAILMMTSLGCFVINDKFHDGSNKVFSKFSLVTGIAGPLLFWPGLVTFTVSKNKLKYYLNVKFMNR